MSNYRSFILCNVLLLVLVVASAIAEESNFRKLINCKEYWAKIEEMPVYSAPNESSEVLDSLEPQEKLCIVGERAEFFIVDWKNHDLMNERIVSQQRTPEVAYVRKVDVIEEPRVEEDVYSRAKRQLHRMRSGVVPDDIYGPFRPVIDYFHPPTKCRAGEEICERVQQLQEDRELEQEVVEGKIEEPKKD